MIKLFRLKAASYSYMGKNNAKGKYEFNLNSEVNYLIHSYHERFTCVKSSFLYFISLKFPRNHDCSLKISSYISA